MVGRNLQESCDFNKYEFFTPSFSELDLLDNTSVYEYIDKISPNIIIHCAGKVGGIQSNMSDPVGYFVENLNIGMNVVLSAKKAGVKKLINLGSSCMYPKDYKSPLKEEYLLEGVLEPTNEGYALAKISVAKLCEYISSKEPEFMYKTLIPCNLYGRFDKFNPLNSHLIPAIIHKTQLAIEDGKDVEIWGDGNARREFMYVGDLAECVWQVAQKIEEVPQYMNVGLGYDYTINEYYEVISKVLGFNGEFIYDLSKPVGMQQKLVDISRLDIFGFKAKTSLEEGIKKTYEFYLKVRGEFNGR